MIIKNRYLISYYLYTKLHMKVSDILSTKGKDIYSVTGETTVYDALKVMSDTNVGALLVIDEGKLSGIVSERDYARKVALQGKSSQETLIKEIMTSHVLTVEPSDSIDRCMELMSDKHIRHLPVLKEGQVMGIISIGDVVNTIIKSQRDTIDQLKNYISQ